MRSVSVKELKDDPGRYLDEVLAGEEVVIKDHNKPVAKIIPFSANGEIDTRRAKPTAKKKARGPLPPLEEDPLYITDEELEAHEARLVAEGKMRLPKIEPTPEFWDEFFKEPAPNIPLNEISQLINEDRDENDGDNEDDAYLEKLVAEGRARPPINDGPLPPEFWEEPPINVSEKELIALVSEDRDEDRIWPH